MDFTGAPYPIVSNAQGLLGSQTGVNQVKSDLLALLLTNPGERIMLPSFGTPLRALLFEQNDSTLIEKTRQAIISAIKTWEPRIAIKSINVYNSYSDSQTSEDGENILHVQIEFFDPENIKDVQELKLELPIAGGK